MSEKSEQEMFSYTGACRFCGQMRTIQSAHVWPPQVIDDYVTKECSCDEATRYARRMEAKENAEKAVENLFGEKSKLKVRYGISLDEGLKEFMLEVVGMISEGKLLRCSIDEGRVKIRISAQGDGGIKLKWTYSASEEEKA